MRVRPPWLAAGFLSIGLVAHVSADQLPRRNSTLPLRVNRAMDAAQARGQLPARDAASPEQKTGTAIIRGRVVAADTGRPLRRARVALSGQNRATSRTATTDLQGRYELRDLPAGRYETLLVRRSGFLALRYGQRRPGEVPRAIEIADGQALDGIDFALPRMSFISGRVLDELGEPIPDVVMYAMQRRYVGGTRRLVPVGQAARTDEAGEYRLFGLEPGEYCVLASINEKWTDDTTREVLAYAATYYPGTSNAAEAQRLRIEVAQEVAGIDFGLVATRASKIAGVVLDSRGLPIGGGRVTLQREVRGDSLVAISTIGSAVTNADGTFMIADVPAGEYRLNAGGSAGKGLSGESGSTAVTVTGGDLEVAITTGPGPRLTGHVVAADGRPPPLKPERVTITARPLEPFMDGYRAPSAGSRLQDDWTFDIGAAPGPQQLSATVPDGWTVKAVLLHGQDFTDRPIETRSGRVDGLQIVLTDRITALSGRVLAGARHEPTADAAIVAFATESARWGDNSRFVRAVRPNQHGVFEIEALPPAEYFIVALDYVLDSEWRDPDFLTRLREQAVRISLAEGEARNLDLEVVPR